jgi:hypothetical protein
MARISCGGCQSTVPSPGEDLTGVVEGRAMTLEQAIEYALETQTN